MHQADQVIKNNCQAPQEAPRMHQADQVIKNNRFAAEWRRYQRRSPQPAHKKAAHRSAAVQADQMVDSAIARGQRLVDGGIDGFALCADYCFNSGPFLSPQMFSEFVTPYLARLIEAYRQMGAYVIKHSDGNIMPILDQLLSCNPHAIHSLDTQAENMDLGVIKQMA